MRIFSDFAKEQYTFVQESRKVLFDYCKMPFNLFSHVITHEFHHKGQMLSISRRLGYIPVDTDIL